MTVQSKPNTYTKVWASSGSKIAADDFKLTRGWEVEKPPYEIMNWVQNRQDQWIAHANQRGISSWDLNTEYKANVSYVTGSTTGNVYRAVTNSVNINPETDVSGAWVIAFSTPTASGLAYLAKAANLSDVANVATARTNLNVYSKAEAYAKTETYSKVEADSRYLSTTQNLFDVVDKTVARTNLSVYSKAEVDALFPAGEVCMFAMGTMPAAFIPCDGRSLSRAAYPRLFTAIGTLYGSVDSTTFNVPEFRGEFLRAWSAGRSGVDIGRSMGQWQNMEIQSHDHLQVFLNYEAGGGFAEEARGTPDLHERRNRRTDPTGGNETRPRNYPVYVGIRI